MATIFSDNFNTGSDPDASNWDQNNTAANWILTGGVAQNDTSSGFTSLITDVPAHAAIADCKVSVKRASGAGFDGGPMARADAAGDNGYLLDCYGTNNVDIIRRNGGVDTTVASRNTTHANGDVFRLEVTGSGATVTIRVYKNGTQMGADVTDTSGSRITTAGRCGIGCYGGVTQAFDDFLVEDFSAPNTTITPSVGALALAGIAAVVTAFAPIRPNVATVSITGISPVISTQGFTTPATGSAALNGIAPVLTKVDNRIPGTGSLAATGVAPVVTRVAVIQPNGGSLALSGIAPSLELSLPSPVPYDAVLTGNAPSVSIGATITPAGTSLTTAGVAPSVVAQLGITPTAGSAAFTGIAPLITQAAFRTPLVGSLAFNGLSPAVLIPQTATPGTGSLVLAGTVPVVDGQLGITPATASLSFVGIAPVITRAFTITPSVASLTVNGVQVVVATSVSLTLPSNALALTGIAPVLTVSAGNPFIRPGTGTLVLDGRQPFLPGSSQRSGTGGGGVARSSGSVGSSGVGSGGVSG